MIVIASGAEQSMARHRKIEDGLLRSARNDDQIYHRGSHTRLRGLAAQCVRAVQIFSAPEQDEGVGNAGGSMHPQSRVQNG